MIGSKRIAACAAIALMVLTRGALADAPRPIESTLSWQMLQLESKYRPITRAKFDLLRSVLQRGTYAAVSKYAQPRYRKQAIETLDAVQVALAEHNFIQPTGGKGWHDTIGDAFEPLQLSPDARARLFAPGELNGFRARYIDFSKPLYFVDDDMAAQLLISVGQRMGWDLRLVSAYDRYSGSERYFVRWHFTPDEALNWDWTINGPTRNETYGVGEGGFYTEWRDRRRYLRSLSQGYARANYLLLLSRHVGRAGDKRYLLEQAMAWDPTHEYVQNSLAWLYATDPALAGTRGRRAVGYALSAWAAAPYDATIADTAACAFAAAGERLLAVQTERFAIEQLRKANRNQEIPEYEGRLRRMDSGGGCGP